MLETCFSGTTYQSKQVETPVLTSFRYSLYKSFLSQTYSSSNHLFNPFNGGNRSFSAAAFTIPQGTGTPARALSRLPAGQNINYYYYSWVAASLNYDFDLSNLSFRCNSQQSNSIVSSSQTESFSESKCSSTSTDLFLQSWRR